MRYTSLLLLMIFYTIVSYGNTSHQYAAGQYIHIHNANIYVEAYGKGPTVILESGLGDGINVWSKVAPSIAQYAHVILYDRAGIEKSKIVKKEYQERTAQMAVDNLKLLLKKMNTPPPYILVGHSLGGLYMQLFAREYPTEVKGVVLVDSMSPGQTVFDPLPSKNAYYYQEAKGMPVSVREVQQAHKFPNIPLVVLSATIRALQYKKS